MTSLQDYLDGLCLTVGLVPADEIEAETIAVLLTKTSAFNLNPRPTTTSEVSGKIGSGREFFLVTAVDRLDDYGNAGVVGLTLEGDNLEVEELALSCRVLGKGVEEDLLGKIADLGRERGVRTVSFTVQPAGTNATAKRFVERLRQSERGPDDQERVLLTLDELEQRRGSLQGSPRRAGARRGPAFSLTAFARRRWARLSPTDRNELFWSTARELRAVEDLADALEASHATVTRVVDEPFVAPRDALEQVVATIWSEVLGVDRVGIHDHFFALGGHSLLITQVLARLRESLDVEVPLHEVFTAPTVAKLVDVIAPDPGTRQQLNEESRILIEVASLSADELEAALSSRQSS